MDSLFSGDALPQLWAELLRSPADRALAARFRALSRAALGGRPATVESLLRWLDQGLVIPSTDTMGGAIATVRGLEKVAPGDWRLLLTADEWRTLEEFTKANLRGPLLERWIEYEGSYANLVRGIRDRVKGEEAEARIRELASRFGSQGFEGDVAKTWNAHLHRRLFGDTVKETQRVPEVVQRFPYWQYRTVDVGESLGGSTRDNHYALHGFVARADWEGWSEILSPHGWGCRCRIVRIAAAEALRRGWTEMFPQGTHHLDAFWALGGSDEGFPREDFATLPLAV